MSTRSLISRLLKASREAHATRQHETAYHALTAAMHAANDAEDVTNLREVLAEARTQIRWIDDHSPDHRLSTMSAGHHNHPGVYEMLARQAEAHIAMIEGGMR